MIFFDMPCRSGTHKQRTAYAVPRQHPFLGGLKIIEVHIFLGSKYQGQADDLRYFG